MDVRNLIRVRIVEGLSYVRPVHWLGIAVLLAVTAYSIRAYAVASCGPCKVTNLYQLNNDHSIIGTNAYLNPVVCAGGNNTQVAIDLGTAKGRTLFAMAQTALLTGRDVEITGTGGCLSGYEAVATMWLKPY
jgi:hypothetical protein